MSLYQEIIFLKHHFEGLWLTENVTPYYEPLIPGKKIGRHIYWSNFMLPNNIHERSMKGIMCGQENDELTKLCKFHEIDLSSYKGEQRKDKIARNLVDYEVGKSILERALNVQKQNKCTQALLF